MITLKTYSFKLIFIKNNHILVQFCEKVKSVISQFRNFWVFLNELTEILIRIFHKSVRVFPTFCFGNFTGYAIRVFHPLPKWVGGKNANLHR